MLRVPAAITLAAIALAAMALAGCSRGGSPDARNATTANGAAGAPAASAPAPQPAGVPQIATSSDGVHVQYRVYGSGEPAVVLVHGWSCDSTYWNAQLEDLGRRFTVVTLDLAGHGASTRNRTEWTMSRYGDDVAAVVAQLRNPKVVLVGHSMGGLVVLEAAARLGDRVLGIIGVDTWKTMGLPPPPKSQVEPRIAAFRKDFVGETRAMVTTTMFTKDASPALVQRIAADMASAPPEVAIPSVEALNAWDYSTVVPRLTVPIVAINSDLGVRTDEARIRKLAPTFRLVEMPHMGHFLMMEHPDEFNPVLVREIEAIVRQ